MLAEADWDLAVKHFVVTLFLTVLGLGRLRWNRCALGVDMISH